MSVTKRLWMRSIENNICMLTEKVVFNIFFIGNKLKNTINVDKKLLLTSVEKKYNKYRQLKYNNN